MFNAVFHQRVATAFLSVCLVMMFLSACSDIVNESYGSFADADANGACQRGWIPSFVPHSATAIQATHNLDTNQQWLTFQVTPADLQEIRAKLTPVAVEKSVSPRLVPSWWPDDLKRITANTPTKYDLFICRDTVLVTTDWFIALDKESSKLWLWDTR